MSVERLDQSRDRIRESRTTMMEMEDLGVSALQDLSWHQQTLLHSQPVSKILTSVRSKPSVHTDYIINWLVLCSGPTDEEKYASFYLFVCDFDQITNVSKCLYIYSCRDHCMSEETHNM
ncbi:unnamed protein product [Eruca vesicaria subsp. sativa]|uniref:Uncharacterized protein n=1 Tax=Eruca vesicaria subsp. sativa TaxID=29727 RepID=A0ABC8LIK8_ERUVS|nr:unnamed protein product [Eruca vesicaria subsp. sativa]